MDKAASDSARIFSVSQRLVTQKKLAAIHADILDPPPPPPPLTSKPVPAPIYATVVRFQCHFHRCILPDSLLFWVERTNHPLAPQLKCRCLPSRRSEFYPHAKIFGFSAFFFNFLKSQTNADTVFQRPTAPKPKVCLRSKEPRSGF